MAPVEAVLEAAGLHARRVEAARRFGMAAPMAVGLAGKKNRGGERRRGVGRGRGASEERSGARRRPGGAPIGGVGGRWARKPAAAAACQGPRKLEVEEG